MLNLGFLGAGLSLVTELDFSELVFNLLALAVVSVRCLVVTFELICNLVGFAWRFLLLVLIDDLDSMVSWVLLLIE